MYDSGSGKNVGGREMIKGKAKMEFGTGDIRMTGVLSEAHCVALLKNHIRLVKKFLLKIRGAQMKPK